MDTTTARLEALYERRSSAAGRLAEIEQSRRDATRQVADASAALAQIEREGASAPKRRQAEEMLAGAKAKADQPWSERIAGAQAATRDADRLLRDHVAANLGELVTALESEGEAAAHAVDEAAANLVTAQLERDRIAAAIGQLITMVSRPGPADVSRSRADQLARDAATLAAGGGEDPPRVDRTRPPWSELLAEPEPTDTEAVTA
jgi:hypothetical protein